MHYNALDGKGNEKHCTVRSNYLRTQYSTLDDYFHARTQDHLIYCLLWHRFIRFVPKVCQRLWFIDVHLKQTLNPRRYAFRTAQLLEMLYLALGRLLISADIHL